MRAQDIIVGKFIFDKNTYLVYNVESWKSYFVDYPRSKLTLGTIGGFMDNLLNLPAQTAYPEEWIRILGKGMVTIPKAFRDELGFKEGEIAKIRRFGKRLVIEPRDLIKTEIYTDKELAEMLELDRLPKKLSKKAQKFWQ